MPYNLPTSDAENFTYGTGKLYLETAPRIAGEDPTVEVGIIRSGANLAVSREKIVMEAGSPLQIVDQKVIREKAVFSFTSVEWNFKNLRRLMGAGVCYSVAGCHTIRFGGDSNLAEVALLFTHRMPSGDTINIRLWDAFPSGDLTLTFNEDAYQEFPFAFTAKTVTQNWNGETLPDKEQLFELERIEMPS